MDLSTDQLLYLVRLYYEKLLRPARRQQAHRIRWLYADALIAFELVAVNNDSEYFIITDKGIDVLNSYPRSVWIMHLIDNGMWDEAKYFMTALSKGELAAFLVHEYRSVREMAKKRWNALDPNHPIANAKVTYKIRRTVTP